MGRSRSWHSVVVMLGLALVATVVRVPGLYSRAIWYDEALTFLVASGHARPEWPRTPTLAQEVKEQVEGHASMGQVSEGLRNSDVHPPLYFWLLSQWRKTFGPSVEAARWFSLLCSVGAVLLFYLLLKRCKVRYPTIIALVFALSSYAVYLGNEARHYSLSLFLLCLAALFGYLSVQVAPIGRWRAALYAIITGVSCGLAFGANYLALFPILAVLAWHFVMLWPVSRLRGAIPSIAATLTSSFAWTFFASQYSRGLLRYEEYPGLIAQLRQLLVMNLKVIYTPAGGAPWLPTVVWGFLILLSILTLGLLVKNRHSEDRSVLALLLSLVIAPSLGITVMSLMRHQNIAGSRYVALAGPYLAWFVAYGITVLLSTRRWLGIALLVALLGMQMTGINWGKEAMPGEGGSGAISLNKMIQQTSSQSQIVVVGQGSGRGNPAIATYALDPATWMMVLLEDTDLDEMLEVVTSYEDVWVLLSGENRTSEIEKHLVERLKTEEGYVEVYYRWDSVHLKKAQEPSLDEMTSLCYTPRSMLAPVEAGELSPR